MNSLAFFSQDDLDVGRTSIVKHSIKVNDSVLFKEWYRHIPPGMYEDVKVHIQEMLDVDAIRPSNSLWASGTSLEERWKIMVLYRPVEANCQDY